MVIGEQVSTDAPVTSTDRSWPTASEDDDPYITVNINVTNIDNTTVADFKEYILDLTTIFLDMNDFGLEEPIR